MKNAGKIASALAFACLLLAAVTSACSSVNQGTGSGDGGGDDGSSCFSAYSGSSSCGAGASSGSGSGGTSSGLHFSGSSGGMVKSCNGGTKTSVSGKVYDPAGKNPLYNVTVYITADTLGAFTPGASCKGCSALYPMHVQASAVTGPDGTFHMVGEQMVAGGNVTPPVPFGPGLQLVVQVGKWRKAYAVDVKECADNPIADHTLLLPKSSTDGMGANIPDIAISTGGADSIECLLQRMGVDAKEYVGGKGTTGHIHIFTGANGATTNGGGSPPSPQYLWDKLGDLTPFDVVVLSCEGAETSGLDDTGRKALYDYAANGGRVFASHYHYSFFTPSGPFATEMPPVASWTTCPQFDQDPISGKVATTLTNGMPFPEGNDFKTWLGNVGALSSGDLYPIHFARNNAQVSATNSKSTLWISANKNSNNPGWAQYFSFDTMGSDSVCGRVVYSDLHVSGGPNVTTDNNTDYPGFTTGGITPSGCASHDLTPQEKALEFMLFDLSSCLVKIGDVPVPPPPM
jgi:hypothetical protein